MLLFNIQITEQERAKLWNMLELERWEQQQIVNSLPTKGSIERLEKIKQLQKKVGKAIEPVK